MFLSIPEILIVSVVLSTLFFFMYFVLRGTGLNAYRTASFARLIGGTLVAGVPIGAGIAFCTFMALPRYYIIEGEEEDSYYTRYLLDENFIHECGMRFVLNKTPETYLLVAKAYGDARLKDDEEPVTALPPGKVRIMYGIDGWFKPFPAKAGDEDGDEVMRYVMKQESLKKGFGKR